MAVTIPTLGEVRTLIARQVSLAFTRRDLWELGRPLVYAWLRGDQVLYVGLSAHGVSRPASSGHDRLRDMLASDTVAIWTCKTRVEARQLERKIILELRPPLNNSPLSGGRSRPAARPPVKAVTTATPGEWFTTSEAAQVLRRSPKTIRNTVAKYDLPRRVIGTGRARRRTNLLPLETVERLRELCWGVTPEAVKSEIAEKA